MAEKYMDKLGKEFETLRRKKLMDKPPEKRYAGQMRGWSARLPALTWRTNGRLGKIEVPKPNGSKIADAVIAEYFKQSRQEAILLTGFDDKRQ